MTELTATFLRETGIRIEDCPMLDETRLRGFKRALKESSNFAVDVGKWLNRKDAHEQAAWLKASMQAGRRLFQPWSMEILYSIAILQSVRFSQLEALLGISSKTLTTKLKALKEDGLIERRVFDETPVRIEYSMTKAGLATTALASPLFAHLNTLSVMRQDHPLWRK